MKNSAEVQSEITELDNQIKVHNQKQCSTLSEMNRRDRDVKKLRNKIEYLNNILVYLETSPSEEFLRSELNRIELAIDRREKDYIPLRDGASMSDRRKHKKEYDKKIGTDKLTEEEVALLYMLGVK